MNLPYIIYRIASIRYKQINRVLPKRFWSRVIICESNEEFSEFQGFRVRKSVAEKLGQASNQLPEGITLKVLDGYRSMARQKASWDRKWNIVKSEHPDWSDEQIHTEIKSIIALPAGIPNHVCGGAIDVMLVKNDGTALDFGTSYGASTLHERPKAPMFASGLTTLQMSNRAMLRKAMESAGFVWYPGEWRHYCYGDRMWAVYTGRTECMYGPIELKQG